MKVNTIVVMALMLAGTACADFSYRVTRKTGGMMASMAGAGPQVSTYSFKVQKMKVDDGNSVTITDFDAQTVTTINNASRTYTVKSFSEVAGMAKGADIEAKIDVKETGQKKTVNGFNASEMIMTMQVDIPQARQLGPMQMEMDIWASPDVPGSDQFHDFYRRNADRFPWTTMAGGANPAMQKAIADIQRKMVSLKGVPVQQVIRMKTAGGAGAAAMPQMSSGQNAQMARARAKLEAMAAQGGPAAAAAKQALDRLPAASPGGGGSGSGSGAMIEITMDSSDFSSAPVPDSVFAIPAGFMKGN